ncbi:MAG: hypothetical protein OEV31_01085, partial [Gammaproteobacteria bacterium]|nr:hypothetical protein [Gammaproteobacteria bacterium]
MSVHAPSRKAAFLSLLIFAIALVGIFIPLGHIAHVGQFLKYINHMAVYLLIGGYGLLLTAVYIL